MDNTNTPIDTRQAYIGLAQYWRDFSRRRSLPHNHHERAVDDGVVRMMVRRQENEALREECEATRHLCQKYIAKISQSTERLHQLQKQQTVVIIEPPMPITYRREVRCN